ncbi:MAG TPA: hypothetical protein VMZ53_06925 [Kofleriaceae bacterium]|nr:hypothetical protein [Kofleriaceae bacterium]
MKRASILLVLFAGVSACEQRDPLFCGMHMDDPRCLAGDGGLPEGFVVIGGTVTGLTGSGLVLSNNGSDDKQVSSNGAFSFSTAIPQGSTYDVTVGTQPTNPSEMCTVANGSGTANSDVADIEVTCMPAAYTVGGNVAGFTPGGNIVLTNNGGDDKTITAGGAFTFATPVRSGQPYDVQIKSQQGETCSVVANTGVVGSGPITTIVVVCGSNLFTVGGSPPQGGVTGLNGSVKLHNGNDTITVNANGAFAFPTPLTGGGSSMYNVTVTQQPAYPPAAQNCTVTNGMGTVGTANITNVRVACMTRSFTVGGTASGLNGTVVLRNGGDMLSVSSNGSFTFNNAVQSGFTYGVTVMTQPSGQQCTVSMGSGTVTNSNITNVSVTCINVGVKCGGSYCNNGNICCDPGGSPSCRASNQCSAFELPCDDRADCSGGRLCCADRHNGNLSLQSVSCQSSCNNVNNPIQLCDPTKNECTSGSCQPWGQLSGYYACQ